MKYQKTINLLDKKNDQPSKSRMNTGAVVENDANRNGDVGRQIRF